MEPAMRLLTTGIDSEFACVLKDKRVQRVDIATAWATDGPGLDALEKAAKQRKIRIRALVGIAGGHTTRSALKRLCKLGEVRLVDGNGLFHVKLYLFHRASTSSAWIGSANFTGPGFKKNEEILLETTNTAEVVDLVQGPVEKSRCRMVAPTVEGVLQDVETARHTFA